MNVTVNGELRDLSPDTTVLGLLESLGLSAKTTVVQRNDDIMQQQDHASTLLCEGDVIELVRFVGGG